MKISGGKGKMWVDYYRGEPRYMLLMADGLSYDYNPPTDLSYYQINKLLKHKDDFVRKWAVQLAGEGVELPVNDVSPTVRLAIASRLPNTPTEKRWALAEALLTHEEDAKDRYLNKMTWYGITQDPICG